MPRPTDLRTQILPFPSDKLGPNLEPCYPGWCEDIAPWGWWHVKCYRQVTHLIGARLAVLTEDSILEEAARRVPNSWREFCGGRRNGEWDDPWSSISRDRINEIYHGKRLRKSKGESKCGVSFAKAAMSLLVLEVAAEKCAPKGKPAVDIYEHAYLCPAIYRLDGFTNAEWKKLRSKWGDIKKQTGQDRLDSIRLLVEDREDRDGGARTVTYDTALAVAHALGQAGINVDVERARPLGMPSRSHKPNHCEFVACQDG